MRTEASHSSREPISRQDHITSFLISIGIGFIGGTLAFLASIPMPWLIGALAANATWVLALPGRLNNPVSFPEPLRRGFIVVIAVMIGGTFTPELLNTFPKWWPSFLTIIGFTVIAQSMAYMVFRRVGGFDRPTAFFSASPGGLVESVILGEEAGGDARIIAMLHFIRLTLIVIVVPFGFTWWVGHSVGSAAGASLTPGPQTLAWLDAMLLAIAGIAGFAVARFFKLPAGVIIGPLLASAALHIFGVTEGQVPNWMGAVAQVFMGTGIGVRFSGLRRRMLIQGFGLCLITVSLMLGLAMIIAVFLAPLTATKPEIYMLGFAPAGVIEMSLIALTLGANPVFVTTHHVVRIFACVALMPQIYRLVLAPRNKRKL
ncbi:MAG: AbrB family transcriptional regulator [Burkholderiaceae bacterium]